ncbi:carboxypeptidase-like regulatory domain-containing protein [Granulicella sp. dw_53]|uniref:TonB-dependent receptor n=1 Tax=Granulicella sp. dw_53 TaxID=2719792 RepID=UPI001BD6AFBD|nr:carboxypeptidase-like regulatory domain-containing protein [Granulicella sp. dw_53]
MKRNLWLYAVMFLSFAVHSIAQSTATISGTVTDSSGAVLPGAKVTIHNNGTAAERSFVSDSAGQYVVPSLEPGDYSITVAATGFGGFLVQKYTLQVDQKARVNVQLAPASAGTTVEVQGTVPLIDAESITVGQVIDQRTVQEIPLNGRHFLDLTALVPGSVVAPASGSLTSPSRGLGANSFITAGNREDSVNFMINGVNLNDLSQNQITFQPSINTTSEFKISNSTYSAEYGRSSGSIVNVATRSGTNAFHGEVFDYLRNNYFDARNYFNPKGIRQNGFKRQNFGGAIGGPIWRDRSFFFFSYEGLRQAQEITLKSGVLTAAQRAQFGASPAGAAYAGLLKFIPIANDSTGSQFTGSSPGPVTTDQYTIDISHRIAESDTLHGYYAIQKDTRTEPNLQGNTIPGFGDSRTATRQVLTLNEVHIFNPTVVNEARLGFNRIAIVFTPSTPALPSTYGLNTGVTSGSGLPQITVTGLGLNFGGPSTFPQGRYDTLGIFSDTLTLTRGKHSIKTGGEFRRFIGASFTQDTGTVAFSSIPNFINGLANTFTVTPTNVNSRAFIGAAGGFVQDNWKITPQFVAELGFRFEWNGTPAEGGHRFVNFLESNDTLTQVNTPYKQNYNYEPRVGFSFDLLGNQKTVLRGGFGVLADQPVSGAATNLANNPPNANPLSLTYTSAAFPGLAGIPVGSLYTTASVSALAPRATNPRFKNAYNESFNFNVQQELGFRTVLQVGYIGSVGRHLRIARNLNQFIYPGGVQTRPYPTLSAASSFRAGAALGNITDADSSASSNYNGLWISLNKQTSKGLSFNTSYTWSKSMDINSLGSQGGLNLQNNFDPANNYGLSDFDVRQHFVFSGIYQLPFAGNRLVSGWQLANITQLQTGNPITLTTTSTYAGTIRPTVVGASSTGYTKLTNGNIQYINGTGCSGTTVTPGCTFYAQPTGYGNIRRNSIIGPGFYDTDLSLQKTTKITGTVAFVIRMDAFDFINKASFGQPASSITSGTANSTTAGTTFGQISATRFAVGDLGSSRQLQFAAKVTF